MASAEVDGKGVTQWAEEISDLFDEAAARFSNEMELREHVHSGIQNALRDLYGYDINSTQGEFNTRARGQRSRSPLDRLYGGVVVEWEWAMSASRREHGADQALQYLANLRAHHAAKEAFTAVVSDGRQWGFLKYDPDDHEADLFAGPPPETATEHFTWVPNSAAAVRQFLELVGSHGRTPVTSHNLKNRFGPNADIASQLVTVLGQSMAGRLPQDRTDTLFKEWNRALEVVYGDLDKTDTDLAIEFQQAYRAPVARPLGESLFVLHTYFALVGRLIAVELLAVASGDLDGAPTSWRGLDDAHLLSELRELENGRLPGDLEIANLFEADLFSWWADKAESNNDLLAALRDLLHQVSELAFPSIAFGPQKSADVLRDLYQALVPNKLRKALGEFLTPHWLAEASLIRLREQGADLNAGRVLDPTCGTGTFIVPVLSQRLKRLAAERGDAADADEVQAVLNTVACIDLNPVAVTATRVNFVLALGDFATRGPLTLPVWRADSIVIPEPSAREGTLGPLQGIQHTTLETSLEEAFVIPRSMTTAAQIANLRRLVDDHIAPSGSDEASVAASREEFLVGFDRDFGSQGRSPIPQSEFDNERRVAVRLFDQITSLSLQGRNGVWARLIENAFAPTFVGTFDVVVGNPPWLTWTKLPETWRSQSEPLWRKLGLWFIPQEDGDSFSLQSADIAMLVFAIALARYAKPDGYVGLLTPSALISADPAGRAFRQFRLRPADQDKARFSGFDIPFAPLWVDDWSNINPFAPDAANKPIFLIAKRGQEFGGSTPGSKWNRVERSSIDASSWVRARPSLREAIGTFSPVSPSVSTSAWKFQDSAKPKLIAGGSNDYSFGVGLHTRGANGIYFVSVDRFKPAQGSKKSTVRVVNRPGEGRNKSGEVAALSGTVESELVYPLLRGRDVTHWIAQPDSYFILPHDPQELDRVLTASKFNREYTQAYSWFKRHREILKKRKPPPTRSWNMNGDDWARVEGPLKHMTAEHLVVVRELSARPAAALVESRADFQALGGRRVAPLVDHKLMFCAVNSREEALYLVAMINSTPIQDLLESFVNSVAVSPRGLKRLPIPTFDSNNSLMKGLADAAADAHVEAASGGVSMAVQQTMDALVLKVVEASEDYSPQPKASPKAKPKPKTALETPALF